MGKYKSALSPKVRGYVEWQLEHYHEDKRQLEQYKNDMIPSPVATLSQTGGTSKGGVSMPTENVAIRIVTNPYIVATERSCSAIDRVLSHCDDVDKRLIEMVYWKQTHTAGGAGMIVGLSQAGVYKRLNKMLCAIALEMGLINI